MINELSSLSRALEQAGIVPSQSYRTYIPLPNVSAKAPCIRIWVKNGQVVDFESIDQELAMQLRRFGGNQASFPGLNLISLYRITDESEKKLVTQCIEKPETIDILQLQALCKENAWEPHQNSRIKNCFSATPREMTRLLEIAGNPKENLLTDLAAQCAPFADARVLHESLTKRRVLLIRSSVCLFVNMTCLLPMSVLCANGHNAPHMHYTEMHGGMQDTVCFFSMSFMQSIATKKNDVQHFSKRNPSGLLN